VAKAARTTTQPSRFGFQDALRERNPRRAVNLQFYAYHPDSDVYVYRTPELEVAAKLVAFGRLRRKTLECSQGV